MACTCSSPQEIMPKLAGTFLVDVNTGEVEAHHGYGFSTDDDKDDLKPRKLRGMPWT